MQPYSSHTLRTLTTLLLAAGIALTIPVADAQEYTAKDLVVVQRPLADLMPPPSSQSSSFGITVQVDHPTNTYTIGESVVFSVRTNRNAYLTIVDCGTSGRVHIIFPNRFQQNNYIRAGQTIQVPAGEARFDFQVSGPAGHELIKVIASSNRRPLFNYNQVEPAGPYQTFKEGAPTVARDLEVALRNHHREWDTYNKIIRIVSH